MSKCVKTTQNKRETKELRTNTHHAILKTITSTLTHYAHPEIDHVLALILRRASFTQAGVAAAVKVLQRAHKFKLTDMDHLSEKALYNKLYSFLNLEDMYATSVSKIARLRVLNRLKQNLSFICPDLMSQFLTKQTPHVIYKQGTTDHGKALQSNDMFPTTHLNIITDVVMPKLPDKVQNQLQTLPMVLVGVNKSRLGKNLSSTDELRNLKEAGAIDFILLAPKTKFDIPEFSVRNNYVDIDTFQVLYRNNCDPTDSFFVFPAIPTKYGPEQYGINKTNPMFVTIGNFTVPRVTYEYFRKQNYNLRIMSSSLIMSDLSYEGFMPTSQNYVGREETYSAVSRLFGVPAGNLNEDFVDSNFFRTLSLRLRNLESYIDMPNFCIAKNATVRLFFHYRLSYKSQRVDTIFDPNSPTDILSHSFTIQDTPRISWTDDLDATIEFLKQYSEIRRFQTSIMQHNITDEDIEKGIIDIEQRQREETELDRILANDPIFQQMKAAEEADLKLKKQLDELGLVPDGDADAPKKPHEKRKKIKTELTKAIQKDSNIFVKYTAALKAKSRPYSPDKPLGNDNPYYTEMTEPADINLLFDDILQQGIVGYDIETTGLHPLRGEQILTHQFASRPFTGVLVRQSVFEEHPLLFLRYKFIMESADILKIIHNVKFEYTFVSTCLGTDIVNYFDTMVAAHMLDENNPNGLKWLSGRHLKVDMIEFSEVTYGTKRYDMDSKYSIEYACADSDIALQLYYLFRPQIDAGGTPDEMTKSGGASHRRLFYEIAMPISKILGKMELSGIMMNVGLLNQMRRQVEKDYSRMREELLSLKSDFNPDSARQLGKYLYDDLKLEIISQTKGGQPSTDMKTIRKLAIKYPDLVILNTLVEYSRMAQFKSLYMDSMPKHFNPNTCAIHTQIHQTRTVTSRFSSSEPNLQNLRKNQEE